MLDPTVVTRIRQSIEQTLAPLPVRDVHLLEGEDHTGDDVVFVTIDLAEGAGPVPGQVFIEAMGAVGEVLLSAGDERFPLLRTTRENEAEPADDDVAASP